MKNFKRIMAVLLTVLMITALTVSAMAASIKVTNAEPGDVYKAYLIFTAVADTSGITSTTNISYYASADMAAVLTGTGCPFDVSEEITTGKGYQVVLAEGYDADDVRTWMTANKDALIGAAGDGIDSSAATTAGVAVFLTLPDDSTPLPDGYYMIVSPNEKADAPVITVDTAVGDVNLIDKTLRAPASVDKTADMDDVQVGDTVTYTVSFQATNYYTADTDSNSENDTHLITEYDITDIFDSLAFVGIDSICMYSDEDFETQVGSDIKTTATVTDVTDGKKISIPWASEGAPLYNSPVWVVVKYKMTVTDAILTDGVADNTATVTYAYDSATGTVGDDDETVYTSGISIRKRNDSTSEDPEDYLLDGAKFKLYKTETENGTTTTTWYKWVETNGNGVVTWVANESDATEVEADNDEDTPEFKGLKAGTYYLKETVAPDGYVKAASSFTVVLTFDTDSFDGTIDGEDGTPATALHVDFDVVNSASQPLPSTGGAGTVLLIAGGALLFMATAIVLVTKKRMYNED